jgi:photosynthetic reaction center cytochrome c subunit
MTKMKSKRQIRLSIAAMLLFGLIVCQIWVSGSGLEISAGAQTATSPTPASFDQKSAIAKLKEQIKGRETEPAEKVFKNVQMLKTIPAGRLLAIMEFGYARSLGVDCTHCHVADKWESEENAQKQIARDMAAMAAKINGDMLKSIKNLKSETPTVNCTTCHRGEVKPALNLAVPKV